MKNILTIILVLSTFLVSQSQNMDSLKRVEDIKMNQFIYVVASDGYSVKEWTNNTTTKSTSSSTRIVKIEFSIGKEGVLTDIGKRAANLEPYLKNDPKAYAQFKKGVNHAVKAKRFMKIEYLGYAIAGGSFFSVCWGLIQKEKTGEIGPFLIGGGAGVAVGTVLISVFKYKADKELDAYTPAIQKSIKTYNKNLLVK